MTICFSISQFPSTVSLRSLAAAVALPLSATACGTPSSEAAAAGQDPGATIRDSAGIEIVENHAPVWDSTEFWTVDPEPVFSLGGYDTSPGPARDSSHLVWNIAAAVPLSDGRIAMLAPDGDRKVLVFERSGALFAAFGRSGRGPGELRYPMHLRVLPGDTIVVWDYMSGPIYHYDPSGELLKESRVDARRLLEATRSAEVYPGESMHEPLPDGSFLLERRRQNWRPPTGAGEIYRRPTEYVRIDADYAVHSFGWWESEEELSMRDPYDPNYVPFPARSLATAGGDPLWVYVTNGDRYEVHQFSTDGVLRRIIRRTVAPVPIDDERQRRRIQDMQALNPHRNWTPWDRVFATVPERSHAPITLMFVDAEGYLWIADPAAWDRGGADFNVFDPHGRWLGNVASPILPYWIGADLFLGGRSDPDTWVLTVEGYRLDRRGRLAGPPPG